ncbi:hypothetical protein J6590_102883, partial [Homalodisca vitripennis]
MLLSRRPALGQGEALMEGERGCVNKHDGHVRYRLSSPPTTTPSKTLSVVAQTSEPAQFCPPWRQYCINSTYEGSIHILGHRVSPGGLAN